MEALGDAAYAGDLARLRTVLATGIDLEVRDQSGYTALHDAAEQGETACLEALLAAGASVDSVNPGDGTALSLAVRRNSAACARALIAAGADVNHADRDGKTPFYLALHNGGHRVLKILLRAGADVDYRWLELRNTSFDCPIARRVDQLFKNSDAWKLVDAIRKVGDWPNYVRRRRETVASVVKRAITRNFLPEAINLEIAAFVEPPGGY